MSALAIRAPPRVRSPRWLFTIINPLEIHMLIIPKAAPTAWALTGAITSRSTLAIAGRGITAMQALSGIGMVLTVLMVAQSLISANREERR